MKTPGSSRFIAIAAIFLLSIQSTPSQTNTIVVPREAEAAFGNWKNDIFYAAYFEQVYASTEFSDLPVDTILITDIAFRIEETENRYTNFIASDFELRMFVNSNSMLEIFGHSSLRLDPNEIVYQRDDVRIAGTPGELAFNISFHLDKPFLYDRKRGHLVLAIDDDGMAIIDTHRVAAERGLNVRLLFLIPYEYRLERILPVTKFSYLIPPTIETIRKFAGHTQIIFSHSSAPDSLKIESAASIRGPFTEIPNVEFHQLSSSSMRANIPTSPGSQFFRIRQNLP